MRVFDGKVYEPDHASYEELKSKFEAAQEEEGGAGNAMACVEAAEGFDVTDAVHRRADQAGQGIAGLPGSDRSGGPAAGGAAGRARAATQGQPDRGADDAQPRQERVARYFKILANAEPPRSEELEVELVMRLNRVNEVTELPVTHGSSPYAGLLKQFGLDEGDVKQADAGEIYVGVLGVLADRLFGREEG